MKTYFKVTFMWCESTYCMNLAHAETEAAVAEQYSEYKNVTITPASAYDVRNAKERHMPITEC